MQFRVLNRNASVSSLALVSSWYYILGKLIMK